MSELFDIYTIIILVLAVVIFLRLRSVLGTRTGHERPPYDPYASRDAEPARANERANDTVVPMPPRRDETVRVPRDEEEGEPAERWAGVAPAGSPLARGLDAIDAADRGFDPQHFLQGARAAYEMIVTAFAAGDRKTLKPLLSKDVFEGFSTAIAEREQRGETLETTFVSIDKAEIVEAEVKGKLGQVTVRFVSQLVTATRDRAGTVVDGNPDKVTDVTDIWTFARELGSSDPNWRLVATESA